MGEHRSISYLALCEERFNHFLGNIPDEIYDRLVGELSWSESIEGSEILFTVEVLEKEDAYIHIMVCATGFQKNAPLIPHPITGVLSDEISTSFIIDRKVAKERK